MAGLPTWQHGQAQPVLSSTGVHIWRVSLARPGAEIAAHHDFLSMDEAERAARFHFHQDRRRYTVARSTLRLILSRYLEQQPESFRFQVTDYGKPFLPDSPFQFNVSHAHELALVALVRDRPAGIDVEYNLRRLDDEAALVARFFSPLENVVYQSLAPEQRKQAFFNGWTRKEAYIKARGEGLSHPLDSFDVELRPGQPAAFLNINQDQAETARWSLHAFTPALDYTAAVATPGPAGEYQYFDFGF